ncbi:hypothetical protein CCP3SC1_830012 [Gammaproteobacteria bacterium]
MDGNTIQEIHEVTSCLRLTPRGNQRWSGKKFGHGGIHWYKDHNVTLRMGEVDIRATNTYFHAAKRDRTSRDNLNKYRQREELEFLSSPKILSGPWPSVKVLSASGQQFALGSIDQVSVIAPWEIGTTNAIGK